MVELAWLWIRYQPAAAPVLLVPRTDRINRTALRKIMVVALARKSLTALWRFVVNGVVPEGAALKPAA
jgi:transposase